MKTIELARGNSMRLENAAGATLRVNAGEAWLSLSPWGRHVRAGEAAAINGTDTLLVYALKDASLSLAASQNCRVELRRRGEVASPHPEDLHIDIGSAEALARWAELLCCPPELLREAVRGGGPRLGDVKRHLFVALVRRAKNTG